MEVLLVDIDSKIPNLALMKLSTYHKSKCHTVGLKAKSPDIIYISAIFSKNKHLAKGLEYIYPEAEIYYGGSGYDLSTKLPDEIEFLKPDYSLYPNSDYSLGFTTRGCIRTCEFCIVSKKEGKLKKWQHPKEFHNHSFNKIMLLDNNWIANKNWFMETSEWIIDHNLSVIEHGMDIRILNIAEQLAKLKWHGTMHFAFDNLEDEDAITRGIELLKQSGINLRGQVQFYVLVGYNTTPEEDKYRCRLLKKLGTNAFVMPYVKNQWTKDIARWANRKWLFWSCDIDEYAKNPSRKTA